MVEEATILLLTFLGCSLGLPQMRVAPQKCPLQDGNLIETVLFVPDGNHCRDLCAKNADCLYYHYYAGAGGTDKDKFDATQQPSQCFLYDECSRRVSKATENCPINRENTVAVQAFVRDSPSCQRSCSANEACGYFKYFDSGDSRQPLMCYHLKSCSPRVIRNQECPIELNNYIDHSLFVKRPEDCKERCEDTPECRFYYWYPIDYSPAPLYCYLFRSCEGGADEPQVALVVTGRHPGYYFLDQEESLDIIRAGASCEKSIAANVTSAGRAGAVAEFAQGKVLLCGGRDHQESLLSDCLGYEASTNEWSPHSDLRSPREESASAVVKVDGSRNDGDMFILGGIVNGIRDATVERLRADSKSWTEGVTMPEARSRFCAVALDSKRLAILGGETDDSLATAQMKTLDLENNDWTTQPEMRQTRKDHACLLTEIDGKKGVLVTGGVDELDILLTSAEFYSLDEESWQEVGNLQHGRTEHGMAFISGMATVMGGVAENEFLRSIEFLDNSADEDAPLRMEWRIAAHSLTRPRYDFTVAQVPISALPSDERSMDRCYDLAEITGAFIKRRKK